MQRAPYSVLVWVYSCVTPGVSCRPIAIAQLGRLTGRETRATLAVLRLGDGGPVDGPGLAVGGGLGGPGGAAGRSARHGVLRGDVVRLGAGRDRDGGGGAGRVGVVVAVEAVVALAAAVLALTGRAAVRVPVAVLAVAVLVLARRAAVRVAARLVGPPAVAVIVARGQRRAQRQPATQALRVAHGVRDRAARVRLAHDLRRDARLARARRRLARHPRRRRLRVRLGSV